MRRATYWGTRSWRLFRYFYPRSPCGERRESQNCNRQILWISIHALLAESDAWYAEAWKLPKISIHALLAESDSQCLALASGMYDFYPRSPCGERQCKRCHCPQQRAISIHALLAESDGRINDISRLMKISIHALLAESDCKLQLFSIRHRDFYPRSPCGERLSMGLDGRFKLYFYPRSPCGERPFSIFLPIREALFLSTLSLRRATQIIISGYARDNHFYPRSPCGERRKLPMREPTALHFYPRSPCGERLLLMWYQCNTVVFLSTLSLRRATALGLPGWLRTLISIHALLAESDIVQLQCILGRRYFYPRSPCGERPARLNVHTMPMSISIHALLAESD